MKPSTCIFDDSPLNEEIVESYERRVRAGEHLPAIVIWRDGQTKSILDGRHRVEAMERCGIEGVSGYYETSCTREQAANIRHMLNTKFTKAEVQDILSSALSSGHFEDLVIANPPYRNRKTQRDT